MAAVNERDATATTGLKRSRDESQGPVEINVGGVLFTTTLTTLCSQPGSLLASIFDPCSQFNKCTDDQGRPFLDADGAIFTYVLDYLRTNRVMCLPRDEPQTLAKLFSTADFFGLEHFKEQVRFALLRIGIEGLCKAGFTIDAMAEIGFRASLLRHSGFSAEQLFECCVKDDVAAHAQTGDEVVVRGGQAGLGKFGWAIQPDLSKPQEFCVEVGNFPGCSKYFKDEECMKNYLTNAFNPIDQECKRLNLEIRFLRFEHEALTDRRCFTMRKGPHPAFKSTKQS